MIAIAAVAKYQIQSNKARRIYFAFSFEGIMFTMTREVWRLELVSLNPHSGNRDNRTWSQAIKAQPLPAGIHLLQGGSTSQWPNGSMAFQNQLGMQSSNHGYQGPFHIYTQHISGLHNSSTKMSGKVPDSSCLWLCTTLPLSHQSLPCLSSGWEHE